MINNNNTLKIQRGSTPNQQLQQRIQGVTKPADESAGTNIRNIRITTQTQQKYIPSANKTSTVNGSQLNKGLGNNKNQNVNRITENNQVTISSNNANGILQSTNRVVDRQKALIKQNNDIQERNTVGQIQQNVQNLNNQPTAQQGVQKNDQKASFIIKKTSTNTNKNTGVNNSSQSNSTKPSTQSNTVNPSTIQNTRNSQNQANPISNFSSIAGNPARKLRETTAQNTNNPIQNNQNNANGVNQNSNNIISSSPLTSSIVVNNINLRDTLVSSSANLNNNNRVPDSNQITSNTNPQLQNSPQNFSNLAQLSQLMRNSNLNNGSQQNASNELSNFTALQRSLLLNNVPQQPAQQNPQTSQVSVTNIINIQSPSSNLNSRNTLINSTQQTQQNSSVSATTQAQLRQAGTTHNQITNARGNNEQRQQESNNTNSQIIRPRPLINQSTTNNNSNSTLDVISQRLSGPQSQWMRETQNAIQNIDSIINQTTNALNRIQAHSNSLSGNNSIVENNSRLNAISPSNNQINRRESAVEEMQRDLELMSLQRRQQEQQILARQALEDLRARANNQASQQMRFEQRGNNRIGISGTSSSDSSYNSDEEEEQKFDNLINRQDRHLFSSSSSDNEEERKEERGRTNIQSSIPPIRNSSNPSNVFQLNFRRQGGDSQQQGQQQNIVSRLGIGFNAVQNRRPVNGSPRVGDNQAQTNNRNGNNSNSNSNSQEEQRTFRIILNAGNQMTAMQGMIDLIQMLGGLEGNMGHGRMEALSQQIARLQLSAGLNLSPGLSQNQINEFPLIQLKSIEQDEQCSICLEDWKINDQAKLLGCMHKFHPHCIEAWLKQKTICPNCKEDQIQFFSDNIPENLQ